MTIVAILIVLCFARLVLRTYKWQYLAKCGGTETDAAVSWIEECTRTAAGGATYVFRYYYVRYIRVDGLETEARLLNPKKRLLVGSRLRIRYLPERSEVAVLMEEME